MARKAKAKSASERTAESRAAKIAAGYAQKNFLLRPAALADLERITTRDGCTETEAIERALAALARPGREPSNAELAALVARRLKAAPEGGR
jgi:hypothetical protein